MRDRLTAAVWAGPMEEKEQRGYSLTCLREGRLETSSDIRACLVSPDLHKFGGEGGGGAVSGLAT